jgi:hypothetical protein
MRVLLCSSIDSNKQMMHYIPGHISKREAYDHVKNPLGTLLGKAPVGRDEERHPTDAPQGQSQIHPRRSVLSGEALCRKDGILHDVHEDQPFPLARMDLFALHPARILIRGNLHRDIVADFIFINTHLGLELL